MSAVKLNVLSISSKTKVYTAEWNVPNKPVRLLKSVLEEIIRPFANPEVLSPFIDRNRMNVLPQIITPGIVRYFLKILRT